MDERDIRRFWSKVDVRGPDECWLWKPTRLTSGYGRFKISIGEPRRDWFAHRVSWRIAGDGTVPDGMWVLHKCDVPRCVNPAHLFLGTVEDNTRDMIRKRRDNGGRRVYGPKPPKRPRRTLSIENVKRGAGHHNAKLNDDAVRAIWNMRALGVSAERIAQQLDVSTHTVWDVLAGRAWRHVSPPPSAVQMLQAEGFRTDAFGP